MRNYKIEIHIHDIYKSIKKTYLIIINYSILQPW